MALQPARKPGASWSASTSRTGPKIHAPGGEDAGAASALQIPAAYWSVQPIEDMPDHLLLKGAVLVRILGKLAAGEQEAAGEAPEATAEPLSPDLEAALKEPAYRPEREIWKALKEDGWLNPVAVSLALLAAAFGVMVQALILQGILQIAVNLTTISQRIAAMVILLAFLLALLLDRVPDQHHHCPHGPAAGNSPAHHLPGKAAAPGRPLFPQPLDLRYDPARL